MQKTAEDAALMAQFLDAIDRLSQDEAGRAVGLSGERIRQYRAGEWTRLTAATRRAMQKFLQVVPAQAHDYRDGVEFAIEKMEAALQELRELLRSPEEIAEASHGADPLRPGGRRGGDAA